MSEMGSEALHYPGGTTIRIISIGAQTRGLVGAVEITAPPGQGFPMHIHHKEDETFYVIDGKLLVVIDGTRRELGPGEFLFGPRNVAHGFRSVGVGPAKFVENFLPSGFEELFGVPEMLTPYLTGVKSSGTSEIFGLEIVGPAPE